MKFAILIDIYRLKCGLENLIFCFFFAFGGIKFKKKTCFLGPYSIFLYPIDVFLPLFGYEISWIPATQVAAGFNLHFFENHIPELGRVSVRLGCKYMYSVCVRSGRTGGKLQLAVLLAAWPSCWVLLAAKS